MTAFTPRAAWFLALIALGAAVASFTGDGNGPFGIPWLADPGWLYVLLGAAVAVTLALGLRGSAGQA